MTRFGHSADAQFVCGGIQTLGAAANRQATEKQMMMSLYVTLGVFLLLAVRSPATNRNLIAFTAWSSFAHAAVMGVQASRNMIPRTELVGVAVLFVIGVVLIALAPAKQSVERTSAALAHS